MIILPCTFKALFIWEFQMNFCTCSAKIEKNIMPVLRRSKLRHSKFAPLALGNTDG